jgi:thiamine transport system permease protein
LVPPIIGILFKWNLLNEIFAEPSLMSRALSAIYASFAVAIFVSLIDIAAGLPMAWFIARGKSRWLNVLDGLVDISFILPTVTLGYSLKLFWSDESQGISSFFGESLISPGWLLVILLHFAFSYPVVVRVMVGAMLDYQRVYEEAARTLGAAPFTADRTVTIPILKPSLIASFILAFARSISETGATIMVAGAFENGPILIKKESDLGHMSPMVFVSVFLIIISCLIFVVINLLGTRLKMPIDRVWPLAERKLSTRKMASFRDSITISVFLLLILIPSLFVAFPAAHAVLNGTLNQAVARVGVWQDYWQSLVLSYLIGLIATLLNTVAGLPMAILIVRRRAGRLVSTVLDVLINIPLIIPTIALGVSLKIFWGNVPFIPEFWLIVLAHLSFTYPYFVRSMSAAIERLHIDIENAARILGARPFTVFRTVILPLTKYSLIAGAIIMFTRSVNETGATLAVATQLKTIPVLLVDWVKSEVPEIGLGCGFLIVLSFIILLILRLITRGRY